VDSPNEQVALSACKTLLEKRHEVEANSAQSKRLAEFQRQLTAIASVVPPQPTITIEARPALEAPQPWRTQTLGRHFQTQMAELERQLEQVKAKRAAEVASLTTDRSKYAWLSPDCPCGKPLGECREHPRARLSQRPPEGDWRTWAYIAGRGSGKLEPERKDSAPGREWTHAERLPDSADRKRHT